VVVTAGLIVFLAVADPSGGHDDAPLARWLVAFAAGGAVAAAASLLGRGAAPARRAALLGSAAGVLFGLSAALTKTTVEELDQGVLAVLSDWPVYALLVVGYAGTAFAQSSLQTGALGPAVATQTIFDPLASVLLGMLVFGEHAHDSALGAVATLLAVTAMVGGTARLALVSSRSRSPAR
jgi:hypothetical protein